MMKVSIISHSPKETLALGRILGQGLRAGDVVCLNGDLGAGKTVLTKGIGEALGITQPIISPTFTLIREYTGATGRPTLYHIDLYRLESRGELATLGLEEYIFGDGICVVEWAERAQAPWPPETLWIHIDILTDAVRKLSCETGDPYLAAHLAAYLGTLPHLNHPQEQTTDAAGD